MNKDCERCYTTAELNVCDTCYGKMCLHCFKNHSCDSFINMKANIDYQNELMCMSKEELIGEFVGHAAKELGADKQYLTNLLENVWHHAQLKLYIDRNQFKRFQ